MATTLSTIPRTPCHSTIYEEAVYEYEEIDDESYEKQTPRRSFSSSLGSLIEDPFDKASRRPSLGSSGYLTEDPHDRSSRRTSFGSSVASSLGFSSERPSARRASVGSCSEKSYRRPVGYNTEKTSSSSFEKLTSRSTSFEKLKNSFEIMSLSSKSSSSSSLFSPSQKSPSESSILNRDSLLGSTLKTPSRPIDNSKRFESLKRFTFDKLRSPESEKSIDAALEEALEEVLEGGEPYHRSIREDEIEEAYLLRTGLQTPQDNRGSQISQKGGQESQYSQESQESQCGKPGQQGGQSSHCSSGSQGSSGTLQGRLLPPTPLEDRARCPTPPKISTPPNTEEYEFLFEATSPERSSNANNNNSNNNNNSHSHENKRQVVNIVTGGRRKSAGSWVKTPGARRPQQTTVTYQGWLYKQGSEGLMLWKKRWFVLHEFCLYYYKGPDEEKVLGSLPVPSFKISPVVSDDHVFRKHAFKAEHQNLRTYYFAAETRDQMHHWMNALSLASILQKDTSLRKKQPPPSSSSSGVVGAGVGASAVGPGDRSSASGGSGGSAGRSERPSVSSIASTASPEPEDSDSGFHGYRTRRYRSPDGRSLDEASDISRVQCDRLNTSCESSVVLRPGARQPLYANAPPKPKRLNTSRDYSTSPERSPERDERDPRVYRDHGGGGSRDNSGTRTPDTNCSPDRGGATLHYQPQTSERRTPDTYGATASCGRGGDYEDVYADANAPLSSPQSPLRRPDPRDSFASSRSGGTRLSEEFQFSDSLRSDVRSEESRMLPNSPHSPHIPHNITPSHRHRQSGVPRPHSADFLEYDRRHGKSDEMWSYRRNGGSGETTHHGRVRPKSSMAATNHTSDSDHKELDQQWSEENYAAKMRQSALYQSHMHGGSTTRRYSPAGRGDISTESQHSTGHRVPPVGGAATPELYTSHQPPHLQPGSSNSLRRGMTGLNSHDPHPHGGHDNTPGHPHDTSINSSYGSESPSAGFLRSASARLPKHTNEDSMNTSLQDDSSDGDKKLQQREESMKRLLEWKQRMLQSPLTRKASPRPDPPSTVVPPSRTNPEAYRQQVMNELVSQEARSKGIQGTPYMQTSEKSEKDQNLHTPQTAESLDYSHLSHNGMNPSTMNHSGMSHGSVTPAGGVSNTPGSRPSPQGGSYPAPLSGPDNSGSSGSSSRRKEGRRESSRTRHVSGGESHRRSTEASRYNNALSSDEEDLVEERETRKKTRRNSRRSSADSSVARGRSGSAPDSNRADYRSTTGNERREDQDNISRASDLHSDTLSILRDPLPNVSADVPSSPDYVNIMYDNQQENKSPNGNNSREHVYNERTMSQRAEPVFIDNNEIHKLENKQSESEQTLHVNSNYEQNYVYGDRYYATRDPYYVSDVQMPSLTDNFDNEQSVSNFSHELDKSFDKQTLNRNTNSVRDVSIRYESIDESDKQILYRETNKSYYNPPTHTQEGYNTPLHSQNGGSHPPTHTREDSKGYTSMESSSGYPSFDSHVGALRNDNLMSHVIQRGGFQDDISTGKYSDSGYDTLRAEISLRRDGQKPLRGNWPAEESSPESSSVVRRRGFERTGRRPETWSPEKFDRSWGDLGQDSKLRVDESKVIKEYSYEYITPEKSNDNEHKGSLKSLTDSLKRSTPNLANLESPRMVQETQNISLVKDRIKSFTTQNNEVDPSQNAKEKLRSKSEDRQLLYKNQNNSLSDDLQTKILKEPLTPKMPQFQSSEALVSPLNAEFAISESTVVKAHEAQVKNVSDYSRRDEVLSPSRDINQNNNFMSPGPRKNESKEPRSPQEIMESRLSRTNIRKFVFNEDNSTENRILDRNYNNEKPALMKKPTQPRSVKALLKNFEERSREHMERVNLNNDISRKKFHSDSEMLSDEESSSDEEAQNDIYGSKYDKLPLSPTSSVLAELRKSADINNDDAPPLIPPPRPPKKPMLGGEMDHMDKERGYIRISIAESLQESMKVQEDSDSGAEEPRWLNTSVNYSPSRQRQLTQENVAQIDLDKPPEENAPPPPMFLNTSGLQSPAFRNAPFTEENYLPMSPPKKLGSSSSVIAPGSSTSSLSSKQLPTPEPPYPELFAKTEFEEHTYIEMSGEPANRSSLLTVSDASSTRDIARYAIHEPVFAPESPRYYEIGDKEEVQHYEYIYKGQSHYEAIYMEVPNSEKEIDSREEQKPQIPDKPDDLKSDRKFTGDASMNTSVNKIEGNPQSNASSDADDEASKDLDSLEPPRNPRFSLSDTFRPASYYLSGVEPSSDPDAHDSSDSDLVPPPPIPLSPPPMDDFEQSGPKGKNFDFENLETPDPPPHLRNALNSTRSLRNSQSSSTMEDHSRSTLGREKKKMDKTESSPSLQVDKMRRRPLMDEKLENFQDEDSFILRSEERYPASAAYPEDSNFSGTLPRTTPDAMQGTLAGTLPRNTRDKRKPYQQEDVLLPGEQHEPSARPKSSHDHNTSFLSNHLDMSFSSSKMGEMSFLSNKMENPYENYGFNHNARNYIASPPNVPSSIREYSNMSSSSNNLGPIERDRSSSTGSRPKSPDPYAERNEFSPYHNFPAPRTSLLKMTSPQTVLSPPEPSGSPMIDALRGVQAPMSALSISHLRSPSETSSRGPISPISPTNSIASLAIGNNTSVQPIHMRGASNTSIGSETSPRSAPYYYSDVIRDDSAAILDRSIETPRSRSYQLNNQRDLEANKRQDIGRKVNQISSASDYEHRQERLANELRTSVEFLEGKTTTTPDDRNVYDSDTLRKLKRRAYTPDPEWDAKNIYPYGLSLKMDTPSTINTAGHRRTRSLEGLLEESSSNLNWGASGTSEPHQPGHRNNASSPQSPNNIRPGVPQIATSAPLHNRSVRSPITTDNSVETPRNVLSNMNMQRASVSSLQSGLSIPIGSPTAMSPVPYPATSSSQPGNRDSLVSRESLVSRLSHYDSRSYMSPTLPPQPEEQDWEDDSQWRDQLRRASLRHTRSLETLDENRPRRLGDGGHTDNRPPTRLSIANQQLLQSQPQDEKLPQQNNDIRYTGRNSHRFDEYHVDYREGRHAPNRGPNVDTNREQTCLEGYEWDEAEERFRKPSSNQHHTINQNSHQNKVPNNNNQSFLSDGLPTSIEMDQLCEDTQHRGQTMSPTQHPAPPAPPLHNNQCHSLMAGGEDDTPSSIEEGRLEIECEISEALNQLDQEVSIGQETVQTPSPDVNPPQDVKVGESLPRRRLEGGPAGLMGPNATTRNNNQQQQQAHPLAAHQYANQKYQDHHPHPHTQNPYHHYKSDELLNHYSSHHSNGYGNTNNYNNSNYNNTSDYQHGYTNHHEEALHYAASNDYKHQPSSRGHHQSSSSKAGDEYGHHHQQQYQQQYQQQQQQQQHQQHQHQHSRSANGLQQRPKSHHDLQEYHNNMKNQSEYSPDYDTYGRSLGRGQHSEPHHQLSDSEITVAKQQQVRQSTAEDTGVASIAGVSAGELLGKTHEELVLLLIQLRRHHAALQSARHHTRLERDSQARLAHLDGEHREEHLRRLAGLNHHLHDLDKQYEMGKPLINLVDNMVKLGTLYNGSDARLTALNDYDEQHQRKRPNSFYPVNNHESLEFSRRVQERRIVAEDMLEYEDASANQEDLEGKVMQLYKLDKILHEESLTIQSLQREKEMLERTLLNLNSKSHHGANEGPVELERRKKQRRHLEHELSKLRAHLAVSARKLEETAAENSRLEHEMMMLRQKIQLNMERNIYRDSGSTSEARHIESEMIRVQTLLEDLHRRRVELSTQIEKLTSVQNAAPEPELRGVPAGGYDTSPTRRRRSTWVETDLDGNSSRDRGQDTPQERRQLTEPLYMGPISDYPETPELSDGDYPPPPPPPEHMQSSYSELGSGGIASPPTPSDDHIGSRYSTAHSDMADLKPRQPLMNGDLEELLSLHDSTDSDFMKAVDFASQDRDAIDNKPDGEEQTHNTSHLDINEADDRMKRYYGILPKEKPLEIKTVRIVKRESTERKKDRGTGKRVTIGDSALTYVDEDEVDSEAGSDVENEPPVSTAISSFAARSASLPRNYGSRGPGDRVSMMAAMMRTPGSGTPAGTITRPSNLALKTNSSTWKAKNENSKDRPMSAHEQLFGISRDAENTPPTSPAKSDPPSPVFKSAAAREIIKEMATEAEKFRRAVPKEKRRHLTISSSRPLALETNSNVEEGARSRDDCDMVRALRPRNHPDVVKSTLSSRDLRFNESTIDSIFGAPSKIIIPERYMPDEDDEKEISEAEKKKRKQKAESIRKMLAQEPVNSNSELEMSKGGDASSETKAKVEAVKEREHILALNQILARQVMEKSRVVAAHNILESPR